MPSRMEIIVATDSLEDCYLWAKFFMTTEQLKDLKARVAALRRYL